MKYYKITIIMKCKSYYAIWSSVTNLLRAFSGIIINIIFNTQIFPFSKLIRPY